MHTCCYHLDSFYLRTRAVTTLNVQEAFLENVWEGWLF